VTRFSSRRADAAAPRFLYLYFAAHDDALRFVTNVLERAALAAVVEW
jgi:hypothetical protein